MAATASPLWCSLQVLAVISLATAFPPPTPPPPPACQGTVASSASHMPLPLANVTACGKSVLADASGTFTIPGCACPCIVHAWARQYFPVLHVSVATPGHVVTLLPRSIPGFPATDWRFEGWVVEAQSGPVPGTDISFLAHPSAYRPPQGDRVFLTTTANRHAGPGWTQGYWQPVSGGRASALRGPLVNGSNAAMRGTAFTGRMLVADGRLLMLIGMGKVSLLENKNLQDPSRAADWVAAEGDGLIKVDWTGAPTAKHEDYRLHRFERGYACNGTMLKNWLFVVPDGVGAGRACGRLGFASDQLTGPYRFCHWLELPTETETKTRKEQEQGGGGSFCDGGGPGSNCDAWPGDVIQDGKDGSLYLVNGWGNIYKAAPGTLRFQRLGNATIARPAPAGSWDDLHQIEFTFLPPREAGGRWRLYHASYASASSNTAASRADCGYKQAIGEYSFTWNDGPSSLSSSSSSSSSPSSWTTEPRMRSARWTLGVGVLGGSTIYAVGGQEGEADASILASAEAFRPANLTSADQGSSGGTWTPVANLSLPRVGLGVAALGNRLFAVGGWSVSAGPAGLALVEAFDPVADAWSTQASLQIPRDHPCVAVVGSDLFVFGGCNGWDAAGDYCTNFTTSLEVYDEDADRWSFLDAPMPTPRYGAGVAVVGDLVYVIGGEDGKGSRLAVVEIFDPSARGGKGVWHAGPQLPAPRAWFGTAVREADGTIFVVGGCGDDCATPERSVLTLDTTSGPRSSRSMDDAPSHDYDSRSTSTTWVVRPDLRLPEPRYEFDVAFSDGRLFAIGGLRNHNASDVLSSVVAITPPAVVSTTASV